jgi:hypothetical protein
MTGSRLGLPMRQVFTTSTEADASFWRKYRLGDGLRRS